MRAEGEGDLGIMLPGTETVLCAGHCSKPVQISTHQGKEHDHVTR